MKYLLRLWLVVVIVLSAGCTPIGDPPTDQLQPPQISPVTNILQADEAVQISAVQQNVEVRYTVNGTLPGPANGQILNGDAVTLSGIWSNAGAVTIRARTFKQEWRDSGETVRQYLISPAAAPLIMPTNSQGSSSLTNSRPVTISLTSATPDAVIRYTLNGSDPGAEGAVLYEGPFVLSNTAMVRAVAIHSNVGQSSIAQYGYIVTGSVSYPFVGPGSGSYSTTPLTVNFTDPVGGPDLVFLSTTNGLDPDGGVETYQGSSRQIIYDANLSNKALILKVVASNTVSGIVSPVVSAGYRFAAEQPQVADGFPVSGVYTNYTNVQFSYDQTASSIYYTTNGVVPTTNDHVIQTETLGISNSKTVMVRAFDNNNLLPPSTVLTLQYRLRPDPPQFTLPGGEYSSSHTITIETNVYNYIEGIKVHYTTDGSDPTGSSAEYSAPIAVSGEFTLKAAAFKAGWERSRITAQWYREDDSGGSAASSSSSGTGGAPLYVSAFGFGGYNDTDVYYFGNPLASMSYSWIELTVRDGARVTADPWTLRSYVSDDTYYELLNNGGLAAYNWPLADGDVIRLTITDGFGWSEWDKLQAAPDRYDAYLNHGSLAVDRNYGLFYLYGSSISDPLQGVPYRQSLTGSFTSGGGMEALNYLLGQSLWDQSNDTSYVVYTGQPSNTMVLATQDLPVNRNGWQAVSMTANTDSAQIFTSFNVHWGSGYGDMSLNNLQTQLTNMTGNQPATVSGTYTGVLTAVFDYDGIGTHCFALQDDNGAVLFYTNQANPNAVTPGDSVTVTVHQGERINGCPFVTVFTYEPSASGPGQLYYNTGAFFFEQAIGRFWCYDGTVYNINSSGDGDFGVDRQLFHTAATNVSYFTGQSGRFFGVVTYSNGQYRLELPGSDYHVP